MDHDKHLDFLKALADALHQCDENVQDGSSQPVARFTIAPVPPYDTPNWWEHCHVGDLTAEGLIEVLKMLGAMPDPPARTGTVDATNTPSDAANFAQQHGHLAAQITDVFEGINPLDMQVAVLDHREADAPDVIHAIDDVLGDRYDALADEDEDDA